MSIDDLLENMRNSSPNKSLLVVRRLKKRPPTFKLVSIRNSGNRTVKLWSWNQGEITLDDGDRGADWRTLNAALLKRADTRIGLLAALLQAAAQYDGRDIPDTAAIRNAERIERRNEDAVFIR